MKEKDIQIAICKMLSKSPDIAFYTVNTTGLFRRGKFRYSIGKWIRKNAKNENHDGLSDITGMTIDGTYFAIEVKVKGKKPTIEQRDFIECVNDNNGLAGYATDVQEAEQIIRGFDIKL